MSERKGRLGKSGVAWLLLIATPPTIILTGLVSMFAWQVSNGKVTPKWRKPAPASVVVTNPVPAVAEPKTSEPAPR
jgi:hypothetical protein